MNPAATPSTMAGNDMKSTEGVAIGIDTGGTFTDIVCRAADGFIRVTKVPSTPHDPSVAIVTGLERIASEWGVPAAALSRFVHGTTVGTNAVLERKGAAIGLLATRGFGDVVEIGRHMRGRMYDLKPKPAGPAFLLPGSRRREVQERIGANGEVLVPLDEETVRCGVEALVAEGVKSIVVCYLFSFANPDHELRTREIIRSIDPNLTVSISSEVDPGFREYERTVVTAFDAYIKPVIVRYLENLDGAIKARGVVSPLQLMQSRGGVASSQVAARRPVRLFLSGPAGGVIGARLIGSATGRENLISIDIGGTSSDIALIASGAPLIVPEGRIGDWTVRVPMVGVHAIGAGGGSIAWLDAANGLRVGPHSAGAAPGPACYGAGGTEATVTDASLVLGYVNPDYFAAGSLPLDVAKAREVIERRVAVPLGLGIDEAALGIHRVLNAQMAEGIRLVSIREGFDPRDFALVPLGGGGPVHATALANELDIDAIVLPRRPGVLSATGLLAAPVEHEVSVAFRCALDKASMDEVRARLASLDEQAAELMASEGRSYGNISRHYSCDVCYVGQSHTLEVALDLAHADLLTRLYDDFRTQHDRVYGHSTGSPATFVALRTTHRAFADRLVDEGEFQAQSGEPCKARRRVLFDAGAFDCAVYERDRLPAGTELPGPAIIEQPDTTTVLEPGWRAYVLGNGIIELKR